MIYYSPDPGTAPASTPTPARDSGSTDLSDWITTWAAHPTALVVIAGTLLAGILAALLLRRARRDGVARAGQSVAAPLVLLWEGQGVYQLARLIGIHPAAAFVFALVSAAVLITLAAQADEHHKRHGVLGPNERLVWSVAIPMGFVVALAAHSPAEVALRIGLPSLAALVWKSRYLPDEPPNAEKKRKLGGFRFTPRQIAVRLGMFEATDADIETVNRQRLIQQMTHLEFKRRRGGAFARRRAVKLARLSLSADDVMIAAVRANVARATWFAQPDTAADTGTGITPARAPGHVSDIHPDTDLDNTAAAHPGGRPDIRADIPAGTDTGTAPDTHPDNTRAQRRTLTRAPKASPAQVKARKLRDQNPDITWAQLAAKCGVNERTARRWFEDGGPLATTIPAPSVNGRVPSLTATPKETS